MQFSPAEWAKILEQTLEVCPSQSPLVVQRFGKQYSPPLQMGLPATWVYTQPALYGYLETGEKTHLVTPRFQIAMCLN